ncbi:hypothetical protein U27_06124 [Candidatus Vecturithrix granuli]|uniref:Uncharacterized protein n=1 Tax=Vecturithrix granuli TaxID=1499967 RepID=A0A081C3J3_VECG1|nr:hypothetical protein U27_06124 [Candidatus Vecturithrix granuli]
MKCPFILLAQNPYSFLNTETLKHSNTQTLKRGYMQRFIHCLLFFTFFLTMIGWAWGQIPPQNSMTYFSVGFSQDGKIIPVTNHQVVLAKRPFTILLYLKQPDGILVNASFAPQSFKQAQTGAPLTDIEGFSDLGMAEEPFNPKTLLMVSAIAPHYWYYEHDTHHRFNQVTLQNNILVCERIVGQIMDRDASKTMKSIREIKENALYLVFMKTEWTPDFRQQYEKQREFIQVLFR